jgi:hypothetical protein
MVSKLYQNKQIGLSNILFEKKGGRVVLGRTVVLRSSSRCLNTGSCSFHLVAARETRVAGWC